LSKVASKSRIIAENPAEALVEKFFYIFQKFILTRPGNADILPKSLFFGGGICDEPGDCGPCSPVTFGEYVRGGRGASARASRNRAAEETFTAAYVKTYIARGETAGQGRVAALPACFPKRE
jgi:hypothetical protein